MTDRTVMPSVSMAGGIFAVAFFFGLLMVGEKAGAFADSERAYTGIFSDDSHRTLDLTGSLLLLPIWVATVALVTKGTAQIARYEQ